MSNKPKKASTQSKGERNSVSRKLINATRRDYNRSFDSYANRKLLNLDRKVKNTKFFTEESVRRQAEDLFEIYEGRVTFAACVQAVKTNYVPEFKNKYQHLARKRENT